MVSVCMVVSTMYGSWSVMLHARWKQTLLIDCGVQTARVAVEHVWLNICRVRLQEPTMFGRTVWTDGLNGWLEQIFWRAAL